MTAEKRGSHLSRRLWPAPDAPDLDTGPAAPEAAGPGRARLLHITAGQAEIIVPRQESAVDASGGPSAQLGGLFDIFPELREWHHLTDVTAELAHSTADLAVNTSELLHGLIDRLGLADDDDDGGE